MKVAEATTISITQYTCVLPIAEHLRARGDEVTLICSDERVREGSSFVDQLQERGFHVVNVPMSRRIDPVGDVIAIYRFYRHFKTAAVDVLHTQTAKAGMIGRIAARLAGVPVVVYTAHAFAFHDYLPWWRKQLYATLERFGSRLCDVIVVDSDEVKRRGLQFRVAPAEKIRVIPMGVDTERFSPERRSQLRDEARSALNIPADAPVIGVVARFVQDKGLDTFVEAAVRILDRHPAAIFLMVGDGPLRSHIQEWLAKRGLTGSFRFSGMQSVVEPYYAAMDVFMLPTLREGFGVAFCEALSMEIPVVATRIAPVTDVAIEGVTGLLAEPHDFVGFAASAERLIESPALRAQMGAAGRRRVSEHFSLNRMVRDHQVLFDSLVGARD